MNKGFIKIYRNLTEWEWYKESTTFRLFIHLLITVNWEEKKWQGITIKRGQRLTTQRHLASELFDDETKRQPIRTALSNLENTHEITIEKTPKGSIITVNNYDEYQTLTQDLTTVATTHQPQVQPKANHRATHTKELKELKRNKERELGRPLTPREELEIEIPFRDPNSRFTDEEMKILGLRS